MTGILLARRDDVFIVATPPERTDPRRTSHETAGARDVVTVPVSEAEFQAAALLPGGVLTWPPAASRPDLFATLLSSLAAGEGIALGFRTAHEGTTFSSHAADGSKDALVVAPGDVVGLLASIFQCAPRGVVSPGGNPAERLLIEVRPDGDPGSFRARISSAAGTPPADLTSAGVSGAMMDCLLRTVTGGPGVLMVAGTPGSGRSTTLALLCAAMIGRGMKGVGFGPAAPEGVERLPRHWPFLDALPAAPWDFVVLDDAGKDDLPLAARVAGRGRVVIMSCGPGEAGALACHAAGRLQSAGADGISVSVLAQDLVRRICSECADWVELPAARAAGQGFHQGDLAAAGADGSPKVRKGRGCATCRATGTMGLIGVFEYAGPHNTQKMLPRMREDGWAKVLAGQAHCEDVMSLPGAGTPMRPLREAGAAGAARSAPAAAQPPGAPESPAPSARRAATARGTTGEIEDPLQEPFGTLEEPAVEQTAEDPGADAADVQDAIEAPPGNAVTDAETWANLLNEARSHDAGPGLLEDLIATIQRRASGQEPLVELLAPSRGFHLAKHMVNTAILAVRIGRELENPPDPWQLARLGLLHDVGIANVGIDVATDLPSTVSKESLDQSGSRMSPGLILSTLGVEDQDLEESIRCVHRTTSIKDHAPEKDPVVQVVGIASLVEMNSRGTGPNRPRDVHDATAVVLERHARAFGREVFRALLMAVPIYPVGCHVELSSGDFGRVVSLNPVNYFRPRVEIRVTGGGGGLPERRVIDLARAPFLHIRHRVGGADATAAAKP